MDLTETPSLARGLVESANAMLQHLQLTMGIGSSQMFDDFWREVCRCTELTALQLVFMEDRLASVEEVGVDGISFPLLSQCLSLMMAR